VETQENSLEDGDSDEPKPKLPAKKKG